MRQAAAEAAQSRQVDPEITAEFVVDSIRRQRVTSFFSAPEKDPVASASKESKNGRHINGAHANGTHTNCTHGATNGVHVNGTKKPDATHGELTANEVLEAVRKARDSAMNSSKVTDDVIKAQERKKS